MRRRLELFSLVLSGRCCGVRIPRTRATRPAARTALSASASTLDGLLCCLAMLGCPYNLMIWTWISGVERNPRVPSGVDELCLPHNFLWVPRL